MRILSAVFLAVLGTTGGAGAFAPTHSFAAAAHRRPGASPGGAATAAATATALFMDPVTYLRTEWVSAALCTNQTPRTAAVCLQLGTPDGRAAGFLPRTVRELITSAATADGTLGVSVRRQLKQQAESRDSRLQIRYVDQRADDLKDVESNSVDVVLSLQAAAAMHENGLDWRKGIREAARVLKPGGRLLFVEQVEIDGANYLEYAQQLMTLSGEVPEDVEDRLPIFEEGAADPVPMCPIPHIAGVAVKSENAGLNAAQRKARESREEQERLANLAIEVFEKPLRQRRRKKKDAKADEAAPVSSKK